MQAPDDIRHELPSDLSPAETEALAATAMHLHAKRPNPAPSFRGNLRRKLFDRGGSRLLITTRRRARMLALSYAASGLLLLTVAAIGVAGAGPFAPA